MLFLVGPYCLLVAPTIWYSGFRSRGLRLGEGVFYNFFQPRLLVACSLFYAIGGGPHMFSAFILTMIADITTEKQRFGSSWGYAQLGLMILSVSLQDSSLLRRSIHCTSCSTDISGYRLPVFGHWIMDTILCRVFCDGTPRRGGVRHPRDCRS